MPFVPKSLEAENNRLDEAQVTDETNIGQINDGNIENDGIPQAIPSVDNLPVGISTTVDTILGMAYSESKRSAKLEDTYGAPSIFNKNAIFVYPTSSGANDFKKFYDKAGEDKIFTTDVPTIGQIIENLKEDPKRRLDYSDFVYCKYGEFIPTNRAIVLRRFPFPTFSNLEFIGQEDVKPLSKAVTYFGGETGNELSDILTISGYKNYKELEADMNIISGQGQNKGLNDTPFASSNSTVNKGLKGFSALSGRGDTSGRERTKIEALAGKNWENERKGPENVIHKTHIADVGIGANIDFELNFHYELFSFNGINPRIALLDLLTNLMTLVHHQGDFWGGQNVVLPNSQKFPFIGDQDAFYRGDYSSYLGSVVDWFSEPFKAGGGLSNLIDGLMSGDLSSIGSLLGGVGSTVLDLSSSKSRSSVVGMKALLDSSPLGQYHVTIGNPLSPTVSIGNIIVPSFELTFGDEIGHHGFPTSINLKVDCKVATPLDSTGVQSLFVNGGKSNRLYMKPADFIDATGIVDNGGVKFNSEDIDRNEGTIY